MDVVHAAVQEVSVALGMTCVTSVPVATVKFVHGVDVGVVPAHSVPHPLNGIFPPVARMLEALMVQWVIVITELRFTIRLR